MRAARSRIGAIMAPMLALAACTCGKTEQASLPDASAPDAGTQESGPPLRDAADELSLTPSCLPTLPPGYQPSPWVPPAPNTGACGDDEMKQEIACELDDPGHTSVCELYQISPACRACVLTVVGADGGSGSPGALISDGRFLRLNIGGCVSLVTATPQSYGCGAKIYAAEQCAYDACSHCLDFGVASFGACDVQARLGPCKDQDALATACTNDLRRVTNLSPCMPDADFRQSAEDLAVVFCRQLPDGGGDGG